MCSICEILFFTIRVVYLSYRIILFPYNVRRQLSAMTPIGERRLGIIASTSSAVDGSLLSLRGRIARRTGIVVTFGRTTRRFTGGKRFPCYRNIIQINKTTETRTRVILAGTHTDAATGAAPGPPARDVVSRLIYVSFISRSPSVLVYSYLSHANILTPVSGSAPVFLLPESYYFIVYARYYCFLGKRPRDECGARGTTSRRLRASSRTGPARVNNNKTKRGLVHANTRARRR